VSVLPKSSIINYLLFTVPGVVTRIIESNSYGTGTAIRWRVNILNIKELPCELLYHFRKSKEFFFSWSLKLAVGKSWLALE